MDKKNQTTSKAKLLALKDLTLKDFAHIDFADQNLEKRLINYILEKTQENKDELKVTLEKIYQDNKKNLHIHDILLLNFCFDIKTGYLNDSDLKEYQSGILEIFLDGYYDSYKKKPVNLKCCATNSIYSILTPTCIDKVEDLVDKFLEILPIFLSKCNELASDERISPALTKFIGDKEDVYYSDKAIKFISDNLAEFSSKDQRWIRLYKSSKQSAFLVKIEHDDDLTESRMDIFITPFNHLNPEQTKKVIEFLSSLEEKGLYVVIQW